MIDSILLLFFILDEIKEKRRGERERERERESKSD
jgi:hypothetical protein